MGFWPLVKLLVKKADIILLVVDARMPQLSRNSEIERYIERQGRPFFIVFNKIDLISNEAVSELRKNNPDAFFVSGINNMGIKRMKTEILIFSKRNGIKDPEIGIVGYPNVGKSAIINALSKRAKTRVSSIAGTTKGIQFVKAGGLKIIDSPGVIPVSEKETKLGLIAAKDPEKIKNKDKLVFEIIRFIRFKNKKALENFYDIDIKEGMNDYDVLIEIGRKRGFLKKGGVVDEKRAAIQVIRAWQNGKIKI